MRARKSATWPNVPKLKLPAAKPATPEEIARRTEAVARMRKLRDEIGPIDLTLEELLAEEDGEGGG